MCKKIVILLLFCTYTAYNCRAQFNLPVFMADSGITGVQVAWLKHGKIQTRAAGYADLAHSIPVNNETLFEAASLSKVILAYICHELASQHKLDFDKPLIQYYTYPRLQQDSAAADITARMVLKHLSGLPNWAENPTRASWETSALKTIYRPGTTWHYSGEGFYYLQATVEHILSKNYEDIAIEMVFNPMGMKHSTFQWKETLENKMSFGYTAGGVQKPHAKYRNVNTAYTLLTTATDYLRFLEQISKQQKQAIFRDAVSLYETGKPFPLAKSIWWGPGVGIYQNEKGRFLWHWGDNGYFKSFFMLSADQNEAIVCFSNTENGLILMPQLCRQYFGQATWFEVPAWLE